MRSIKEKTQKLSTMEDRKDRIILTWLRIRRTPLTDTYIPMNIFCFIIGNEIHWLMHYNTSFDRRMAQK